MHMPAAPRQDAIVTAGRADGALETLLWQRLEPARWPLPPEAFPADAALVGGAVRDALLGRLAACPDLDLVVSAGAISLARRLAGRGGGSAVVLDAERDIARVVLAGWTIDLARREGPDLESDLNRRDYSANAIALPLRPGARLQDPTGGLEHLRQGRLVAVSEANLLADPLRLLRGVRLAWELELRLDAGSERWIEHHAPALATVAGERVLAELERLAAAPNGQRGLIHALALGLLEGWQADHHAGAALEDLDPLAAEQRGFTPEETAASLPQARLATLLPTEAVRRLHGSRRLEQRCTRLRRWWQQLSDAATAGPGSRSALEGLPEEARLQLQQELEADLPALLLRVEPAAAREALMRWRDPSDPLFHPRPPLNGDRLRHDLALPPGPQLGALLRHLTRERAFGRLTGSGEPLNRSTLEAARRWLSTPRG
jgi:tRNA nucleotidyltransferase (CCA-adding enzyme)